MPIAWPEKVREGYTNWAAKDSDVVAGPGAFVASEAADSFHASSHPVSYGAGKIVWRSKSRDGHINWAAKTTSPISIISGAFAVSEAVDELTASGDSLSRGAMAAAEAVDSFWASVPSVTFGEFDATEAPDGVQFAGGEVLRGEMVAGEDLDGFEARWFTSGRLTASEAADAFAATGVARLLGHIDAQEAADGFAASGFSGIDGWMSASEGLDHFSASPPRLIPIPHRMAPTALRLITKHGQAVTLRVIEQGAYSPATGSVTQMEVDYPSVGVRLDYEQRHIDGTVIRQGDQKLLMPPQNLPKPETGNVVLMSGKPFRVVSVGAVDPDGKPALYELQLRGVA